MALSFDSIREYCFKKNGVTEDFPFDENTLVFRVHEKIFLLLDIAARPLQFNVKCDPGLALELRERYEAIQPGYHMNKKHWNTVIVDGSIPSKEIYAMIDHSWELIVQSLPKTERELLGKKS